MIYWDLIIWSLDKHYLDKLSDLYDVDYYDCELYFNNEINSWDLTNQLFYYVLSQAVYNLDISEETKEYLTEHIFINCLDSFYNLSDNYLLDINENDRETVEKFISLTK